MTVTLPAGFLASGINVGIKNRKRDLGVIVADRPCALAMCLTNNKARAHSVDRARKILSAETSARAVIVCSGNANALTGPEGAADDEAMAAALAQELGVETNEVITASTGSIAKRLPVDKIKGGVPEAMSALANEAGAFSESIMTTDTVPKVSHREVFISGKKVTLVAVTKGAGMIQPSMATMLCFVTTDAAIDPKVLQEELRGSNDRSFNQITVDNDMSTNDMLVAMASGAAENELITADSPHRAAFSEALRELLEESAIAIARDGEGATKLLIVDITGAASANEANVLAKGIAAGSLVKTALFGADPYASGRILGAIGAKAADIDAAFDTDTLKLDLQGMTVFDSGRPTELSPPDALRLKTRMKDTDIHVAVDLRQGDAAGRAWGCDLTYDYVKINADYSASTTGPTGGSGGSASGIALDGIEPAQKKELLIEALRYIYRFNGRRAVIKLGGAAMVQPELEKKFAEDVLLLESVGLRPIVVHGGGPEISRTLDQLGKDSHFIDGLRVTDESSMNIVEMVLSGKVNQSIVAALNGNGHKGVGLSGKDGALIRAKKYESRHDLGRVGEVASINTKLIDMLLEDGRIPVISPVGLGDDGIAYNINADVVAAELAGALEAEKLIFMSDVPGLLDASQQLISEINADQIRARIELGEITGGMLPKVQAALRSLRGGVDMVHLVDGRVPHNLISELFTDRGVGTLIKKA